jgi:hypothetical protein
VVRHQRPRPVSPFPLRHRVLRVLVEVTESDAAAGLASARAMLHRLGGFAPEQVLVHGENGSAWVVLHEAFVRRLSTRIGLEDTLLLPDGSTAPDNAALVAAAFRIRGETADAR